MICNGNSLLELAPLDSMIPTKERAHGVSFGLSEAGYDLRIKQKVIFTKRHSVDMSVIIDGTSTPGRFAIASTVERFQMPDCLVGVVHDKSTWARQGLSVFNTVIEPGWNGYLTLELVYHGQGELVIPAGAGIAQVLFSRIETPTNYGQGKYQNQADAPVPAIMEGV